MRALALLSLEETNLFDGPWRDEAHERRRPPRERPIPRWSVDVVTWDHDLSMWDAQLW